MEWMSSPRLAREEMKDVLRKRVEAFWKGYRQNLGIIGAAGVGKTYLISDLYRTLAENPESLPVYVSCDVLDLPQLVERWSAAVMAGVLVSAREALPKDTARLLAEVQAKMPRTAEHVVRVRRQARRDKPGQVLRELFALTGVVSEESGKQVTLILDEFHLLERLPASDPFSLLGREIMVEKNTLFIVTSSKPVRAGAIFHEKLSLLFGNFEVLEMRPFDFDEARDLVRWRLGGHRMNSGGERFLISMTDGNPVYLDLLLDRLESRLPSGQPCDVNEELLLAAFHLELFDHRGRIALLFERRIAKCSKFIRDSLLNTRTLIAVARGYSKVASIASHMEAAQQDVRKSLSRLDDEGLVSRRGNFYAVSDPLFRFWISEVFAVRRNYLVPDEHAARLSFMDVLKDRYREFVREDNLPVEERIGLLFRAFRHDTFCIQEKNIRLPQFSEITFRPSRGHVIPLVARNASVRWFCLIAREEVCEEDVNQFLEDIKRFRKGGQKRVLVLLNGIEQNAKLLAQARRVQLWNLRTLNALLSDYGYSKIIVLPREEEQGRLAFVAGQNIPESERAGI